MRVKHVIVNMKQIKTMNKRHILRMTLLLTALMMVWNASAGVKVTGNVYGGGNLADVGQSVTVNISGGEVGGDVYGGGAKAHTNTDNWDESATPKFTQTYHAVTIKEGESVVGYFTDDAGTTPATDPVPAGGGIYYKKTETIVNLTGGVVIQDVYGGGLGYDDEDDSKDQPANVYGDVTVTTTGGKARDVFGANNVLGTPQGIIAVNINGTAADGVRNVYGGGNQATYEGISTTVTMTAGKAVNVYGGGLSADVAGSVTVNIQGGTVTTDVYGGGALGDTNTENESGSTLAPYHEVSLTTGTSLVGYYTESSGTYTRQTSGEAAADGTYYRKTETIVNLTDGSIGRDVYGGGLGQKAVEDDPETSDVDESSAAVEALVYGDVTVNIGTPDAAATPPYSGNITIGGSVFGCNNLNGTPKGDVLVNVYKTAHTTGNQYPSGITTLEGLNSLSDADNNFAIKAVYGGGNLAHYIPVAPTGDNPHSTTVYVYGCSENTIKTVYGGGNAADVGTTGEDGVSANTYVIIEGGRFDVIFGGGNGYSETNNHNDPTAANYNPGANIYGRATTDIQGGLFRQVFGGSNQYGNVRATSLSINKRCDNLLIKESFGGANEADITGDVTTTLACGENQIGTFYGGSNLANITGNVTLNVEGGEYINVFGGSKGRLAQAAVGNEGDPDYTPAVSAKAANISGNVTLNLYGGTMDNAFGGSDVSGNIGGKITVNMLDKGDPCQLTVHNIYGGGRDAAYTPDTPGAYPEVNLIHGTVSKKVVISGESTTYTGGNVFGGGLGITAIVTSNPTIYVGYDTSMATRLSTLSGISTLAESTVSVAGNVYGGGDQAQVTGSTSVTLQEHTAEGFTSGSTVAGDMYGGGNQANVTGSVTVLLTGGSVTHDVYGGGALANTNTDQTTNIGTEQSPDHHSTQVTIAGGTVTGDIFGGGLGRTVADDPTTTDVDESEGSIAALVNGAVTVTVNSGTVADVFGCNNVNGSPQSTVTVNINSNVGGNVYGGGNLAAFSGSPVVNVNNGNVTNSVYGGGKGSTAVVTGNPVVTIGDLSEGHSAYEAIVSGDVYGGGDAAAVTGNTSVTLQKANSTVARLFGGGNAAGVNVNTSVEGTGNTTVELTDGTVSSGVYGGCNTSGTIGGIATVNLTGGTVGASGTIGELVFGGGYGSGTTTTTAIVNVGEVTTTTIEETTTISYSGTSTIYSNVYGGSALGAVGTATVNLNSVTTLSGHVFGGGMGRLADTTANPAITAQAATISTSATVNQRNITMAEDKNIYGGCNVNGTAATTTVNVTGGSVTDVFGGGFGANTYVTGNVVVNIGETNQSDAGATILGDVYGGSAQGHVNLSEPGSGTWPAYNSAATTSVNLYKGIIHGDAYGGGLGLKNGFNGSGSDVPAYVGGNVNVTLNGAAFKITYYDDDTDTPIDESQIVKSGRVFGCNNLYGMPLGNVTVTVHKTVGVTTTNDVTTVNNTKPVKGTGYELAAVYGGGNLADFTSSGKKAIVIINGCDDTSINYVYGGGNAAAVPETDVTINSAYEIGYVFGGGNGKDPYLNDSGWQTNGGANVNGNVSTTLNGGTIHEAFGGSNEKGTISGGVSINTGTNACPLDLGKLYGAGRNADIEGNLIVVLGCMPASKTDEVYGGAENANVKGNVELTITSGTFGKVFGGNNQSGAIFGHIILNIEETGCNPIVIDDLYLGGYQASYSKYGYYVETNLTKDGGSGTSDPTSETVETDGDGRLIFKPRTSATDTHKAVYTYNRTDNSWTVYGQGTAPATAPTYEDPVLNVISATHIGRVFGGGLGSGAVIYGNPTVNINQIYRLVEDSEHPGTYTNYVPSGSSSPTLGEIGDGYTYTGDNNISVTVTGGVFGGGNEAAVEGNTTVNIGSESQVTLTSLNGTSYNVLGANITGNVYGGGNHADVNGNTDVNIWVKKNNDNTYSEVTFPANSPGITITGDVFGGGNEGVVTGSTKVKIKN